MKKIQKQILGIGAGIVLLVMIGLFIQVYPMLSMSPVETGQIPETEIIAINSGVNNAFLIYTDEGSILIDTGIGTDIIAAGLDELAVSDTEIKHILFTHSDSDHVGGRSLFSDAQIYISEDEVQMIDGTIKRNLFVFNEIPDTLTSNLITLTDQQELTIGGHTILCIKTPGHTPGSMSYLIDEKYLFSGDAFQVKDGIMMVHPYTMDAVQGKETISMLDTVKDDIIILTAHYGYYHGHDLMTEP